MLKIYGSLLCPDCVRCCEELDKAGVPYIYCDFSQDLSSLKEFLAIRDSNPLFDSVKQEGRIGIPCIVRPDGTVTLTWEQYVSQDNA